MNINEYASIEQDKDGWISTIVDNGNTITTKHSFMTEAIMFVETYAYSRRQTDAQSSVRNFN